MTRELIGDPNNYARVRIVRKGTEEHPAPDVSGIVWTITRPTEDRPAHADKRARHT